MVRCETVIRSVSSDRDKIIVCIVHVKLDHRDHGTVLTWAHLRHRPMYHVIIVIIIVRFVEYLVTSYMIFVLRCLFRSAAQDVYHSSEQNCEKITTFSSNKLQTRKLYFSAAAESWIMFIATEKWMKDFGQLQLWGPGLLLSEILFIKWMFPAQK